MSDDELQRLRYLLKDAYQEPPKPFLARIVEKLRKKLARPMPNYQRHGQMAVEKLNKRKAA